MAKVSLNLLKIQIVPGDCFPLGVILTERMIVKFRRRKLERQSASQNCELFSDSVLTHCRVRDMQVCPVITAVQIHMG